MLFFVAYLVTLCNVVILLIQKREILTMTRFINFLFFAISGLFLIFAAECFLLLMGDVGMIIGLASLITAILMSCAAVYEIVRD